MYSLSGAMALPDFEELRREKAERLGGKSVSLKSTTKKTASEKNKPLEFTCKKPVHVPGPRGSGLTVRRSSDEPSDPRFNSKIAGDFFSNRFAEDYSFLDEYRDMEKKQMKERLTSRRVSQDEKAEITRQLMRMDSQDISRKRSAVESSVREELRQKELELVEKTGKRAYFHPRSMVKKIIRDRQEDELKKMGKLEEFRAKKERRQVAKERSNLGVPKTRRVVEYNS
jgi:hypothetical protein